MNWVEFGFQKTIKFEGKTPKKIESNIELPKFALVLTGQPNWEYTMWKFQDFFATQILREINFGHFEAPKTAIFTI